MARSAGEVHVLHLRSDSLDVVELATVMVNSPERRRTRTDTDSLVMRMCHAKSH
jgi:hypothetical protein